MEDYLSTVAGLDAKQVAEQKQIDTLTANMRPLAETSQGQFALQDLLANQSAPKTERAAAAQALNPAFKASIGAHGELSFSAAPGASLGYTLPDPMRQEQQTLFGKVATGAQGDMVANFDQTFRTLQSATDIVEVENTYAQLNSSASNFIASKEMEIRNRVRTSLGVPQLEAQIVADKQLDTDFYNKEFGTGYQGPTDESMANLQLLRNETAKVDDMVTKELSTNQEVVALRSRMQGVESLISQKRSISGNAMAATSKDIGASVLPERVESAALALGVDPANPQAAAEIRAQLATGNGPAVKAEELAAKSAIQLVAEASMDTPTAKQAVNVLNSQFANPAEVDYIVTQVKNFDLIYGNTLTNDERAKMTPAATTIGGDAKRAEAAAIQAMKVTYVMDKYQAKRTDEFSTGISKVGQQGGWETPTDPLLVEIPKVVNDIKTAHPDTPLDVSRLAAGMNWSTNRDAKQMALANYVYTMALKEPNNKALGMPSGYHSPEAISKVIGTQIVIATNRLSRSGLQGARATNWIPPAPSVSGPVSTVSESPRRTGYEQPIGVTTESSGRK